MAAGDGWDVIKQPLFVSVVLGLTSLFFVVTGVQYWATSEVTYPVVDTVSLWYCFC